MLQPQPQGTTLQFSVILRVPQGCENALPYCLQGFCQQGIEDAAWEILAFAESTRGQELLLAERRLPLQSISATCFSDFAQQALAQARGKYILFFEAHSQPHPDLLNEFHKALQKLTPRQGLMGNTHVHPMQAMSLLALATQTEQLMFSFYPLQAPQSLPLAHWRWHNLCLPRVAFEKLSQAFEHPYFWGWHLAFQLWAQGWRLQGAIKARSCMLMALSLDSLLLPWQKACEQELCDFVRQHPYPLADTESGLQLWADVQSLSAHELETLNQSQQQICVPLEPDDEASQQLERWRQQLRRLWWSVPSEILAQQKDDSLAPVLKRLRLAKRLLSRSDLSSMSQIQTVQRPEDCQNLGELVALAPAVGQDLMALFLAVHAQLPAGAFLLLPHYDVQGETHALSLSLRQLIESHYPYVLLSPVSERPLLCRLPT